MLISVIGGHINSADIIRVTQGRDITAVKTRDGETWSSYADGDDIAVACSPVVAAHPGFSAIRAWHQEGEDFFVTREPVVAWRIDAHSAIPVTPDHHDDGFAVLCPDGHVVIPGDCTFENEAAWLEEMKRRHKRDAA